MKMMKKVLIGFGIILILFVATAVIVPILFKDDIKAAIDKEIAKTKKLFERQLDTLIPWTRNEIELLSYFVSEKSERKGFGYSFRGIFTSVYQENMMIFQHKVPFGNTKNGFTVVISDNHEILYDSKDKVYVNGEYIGDMDSKKRFSNAKIRRVFGYLDEERYNKYEIINILWAQLI